MINHARPVCRNLRHCHSARHQVISRVSVSTFAAQASPTATIASLFEHVRRKAPQGPRRTQHVACIPAPATPLDIGDAKLETCQDHINCNRAGHKNVVKCQHAASVPSPLPSPDVTRETSDTLNQRLALTDFAAGPVISTSASAAG